MITIEDYSDLKGNTLKCIQEGNYRWKANGQKEAIGFVAQIDFNVGITIKCVDNQENLVCLNKKEIESGLFMTGGTYEERFNYLVKSIKSGEYIGRQLTSNFRNATCAFEGK